MNAGWLLVPVLVGGACTGPSVAPTGGSARVTSGVSGTTNAVPGGHATGPTATPLPTTPTVRTTVDDVAFATPERGWALADRCTVGLGAGDLCTILVSRTDDGGLSWTAPVTVGTPQVSVQSMTPRHLRFAGERGWVFGDGIYSTEDGGGTWRQDSVPSGSIQALEPVGDSVWAVEGCSRDSPCQPILLTPGEGGWWTPARVQLPNSPDAQEEQMLRPVAGIAFVEEGVLNRQTNTPAGTSRLVRTLDGGASWTEVPSPCDPAVRLKHLVSLDGRKLFGHCEGGVGVDSYFVSADSGLHWERHGASDQSWFPRALTSLALVGVDTVVAGGDHQGIMRLSSGATGWAPARRDIQMTQFPAFVSELWFVDGADGWALVQEGNDTSHLWRTRDGGLGWDEVPAWPT